MIVLEHTNPPTIYLDYHYWLPERGASGIMIGGEYYRYTDSGAFITCNPSPGGELGLGSPLTKKKVPFRIIIGLMLDGLMLDMVMVGANLHGQEFSIKIVTTTLIPITVVLDVLDYQRTKWRYPGSPH